MNLEQLKFEEATCHILVSSASPNRLDALPPDLLTAIWSLLPVLQAVSIHHRVCKSLLLNLKMSADLWHRYYRYLCATGEFDGKVSVASVAYVPPAHIAVGDDARYRERCREVKEAQCMSWGNPTNLCLGHSCAVLGGQPGTIGPAGEAVGSYNRVDALGFGFVRGPVRLSHSHEHHASAIARDGTILTWGHKACGQERPLGREPSGPTTPPARGLSGSEFGERPMQVEWLLEWLGESGDEPLDIDAGHNVVMLRTAAHRILVLEQERKLVRVWQCELPLVDAGCASWHPLALDEQGTVYELLRRPDTGDLETIRRHTSAANIVPTDDANGHDDRFTVLDAGYDHAALLTAAGRLYFLGKARSHGLHCERCEVNQCNCDLAGPGRQAYHRILAEQQGLQVAHGFEEGHQEFQATQLADHWNIGPIELHLPTEDRAVAVSCAASHTVVLGATGAVYAIGSNQRGELGLGHTTQSQSLQQMVLPGPAVAVSAGADYWKGGHSIILLSDGTAWGCGSNSCGELGTADAQHELEHTDIPLGQPSRTAVPNTDDGIHTPRRLDWFEPRGLKVLGVVAAENISWALVTTRRV
jgi:alpha-tubulin suppressor-like RCC1 family protein